MLRSAVKGAGRKIGFCGLLTDGPIIVIESVLRDGQVSEFRLFQELGAKT